MTLIRPNKLKMHVAITLLWVKPFHKCLVMTLLKVKSTKIWKGFVDSRRKRNLRSHSLKCVFIATKLPLSLNYTKELENYQAMLCINIKQPSFTTMSAAFYQGTLRRLSPLEAIFGQPQKRLAVAYKLVD